MKQYLTGTFSAVHDSGELKIKFTNIPELFVLHTTPMMSDEPNGKKDEDADDRNPNNFSFHNSDKTSCVLLSGKEQESFQAATALLHFLRRHIEIPVHFKFGRKLFGGNRLPLFRWAQPLCAVCQLYFHIETFYTVCPAI